VRELVGGHVEARGVAVAELHLVPVPVGVVGRRAGLLAEVDRGDQLGAGVVVGVVAERVGVIDVAIAVAGRVVAVRALRDAGRAARGRAGDLADRALGLDGDVGVELGAEQRGTIAATTSSTPMCSAATWPVVERRRSMTGTLAAP
jgi:hypothetical protein